MLQNDYVLLLDELRLKLLDVKPQIDDLADAIGLNPLKEELSQLEGQTAQEGFWNDLAGTQKILQRISRIKDEISSYQKLASAYEDVMTLVELGMDSPEESEATFEEAKLEYNALMDELETKKLATLLKGEYDGNNAIPDALPDVHPLGGAPRLQMQGAGLPQRRGRRGQKRLHPH